MFGRIGRVKSDKLLTEYVEDRVFQLLSPAFRTLSAQYNDLTPVEVWHEAKDILERLIKINSRRDVVMDTVYPELLQRYKCFEDENRNVINRNDEQTKRTTDMVLTAVMFMLACTTKGENPHRLIMERLKCVLQKSETTAFIIAQAEKNEVEEEKRQGEIPEHDYLHVSDKMDDVRQMLLLPMEAGFVVSGHTAKYADFVNALLDNVEIQAFMLSDKSRGREFNVKSVCWVAGLLITRKILNCTPYRLSNQYNISNSNKWMSPSAVDENLPKNTKDIIDGLIKEYFERKSSC